MYDLAAATAVPVSTGFTWTTAAVGLLNLLVGGVLVAIIKSRPALKKLTNDREANLLKERADEMEKMRASITALQARLDQKDAQHDAERSLDRHRINNLQQCLDGFFMLVKANPDKAAEAVATIEAMRAKQIVAEASEKAAIHAARIAATNAQGKDSEA